MTNNSTKTSTKSPRRFARQPTQIAATSTQTVAAPDAGASTVARKPNKQDLVIDLMKRPEGASLEQMIAATGWLPHSTRAALTGLRKKGHAIERVKRDDVTVSRAAAALAGRVCRRPSARPVDRRFSQPVCGSQGWPRRCTATLNNGNALQGTRARNCQATRSATRVDGDPC